MSLKNVHPTHTLFISSSSSSSSSFIPQPRGSLGHHRWFRNQFSPCFPVLHCPLGPAELQACPLPDVVFPPLPLSALSSYSCQCAFQNGFGQTWWTGDMTIPLRFASLHDRQEVFVWSSYLACILLWSSAVRVHDSQAYRKMDVTRERISRILELREILLSFQTGFSLVNAAVVCAPG